MLIRFPGRQSSLGHYDRHTLKILSKGAFVTDTGWLLHIHSGLLGDRAHQVYMIGLEDGIVNGVHHWHREASACSFSSLRRQSSSSWYDRLRRWSCKGCSSLTQGNMLTFGQVSQETRVSAGSSGSMNQQICTEMMVLKRPFVSDTWEVSACSFMSPGRWYICHIIRVSTVGLPRWSWMAAIYSGLPHHLENLEKWWKLFQSLQNIMEKWEETWKKWEFHFTPHNKCFPFKIWFFQMICPSKITCIRH